MGWNFKSQIRHAKSLCLTKYKRSTTLTGFHTPRNEVFPMNNLPAHSSSSFIFRVVKRGIFPRIKQKNRPEMGLAMKKYYVRGARKRYLLNRNKITRKLIVQDLNEIGATRLMVITSKKHLGRKAVTRNYARRRLRHACADVLSYFLKPGYDVYIIARPPCLLMPMKDLRVELASVLAASNTHVNELPFTTLLPQIDPTPINEDGEEYRYWGLSKDLWLRFYSPKKGMGMARALFSKSIQLNELDNTHRQLNELFNKILLDGGAISDLMNEGTNSRDLRRRRIGDIRRKGYLNKHIIYMMTILSETDSTDIFFEIVLEFNQMYREKQVRKFRNPYVKGRD